MIAWAKEPWEEVKNVLEALDIDYMTDFKGNLILHFQDFDVRNERSNTKIDHVDHLFIEFMFNRGTSYEMKMTRTDVYYNYQSYVLPHCNENGMSQCTGNHTTKNSLCGDIVYFSKWIKDYNSGSQWYNPSKESYKLKPDSKIEERLIPTFYMDVTKGFPCVQDVELVGQLIDYIETPKVNNPQTFYWKGQVLEKTVKGTTIGKVNLNDYFNYGKFIERYNHHTSTLSDTSSVSEAQ